VLFDGLTGRAQMFVLGEADGQSQISEVG
jgi:hypothetical protein